MLAALIHDAGMLRVPAAILTQTDPLTPEQRRLVEGHCRTGAEIAARLRPDAVWLAQAIAEHHERLDGTGYPAGLRGGQMSSLSRLLAVCDVYAASCTARPYRKAKETAHGLDRCASDGRQRRRWIAIMRSGCWSCPSIPWARRSKQPTVRWAW